MDLEDQQKRIISEQRDQLMQLREQLKQAKGTQKLTLAEIKNLFLQYKGKQSGTTIGLMVPTALRNRLLTQVEKKGAKAYKDVIFACIDIGLRALEGSEDVPSPVAPVQDVLRTDDPGNSPDPSSN